MKQVSKKGKKQINEDVRTYKLVFEASDHSCDECGAFLGDTFDINGSVLNRWRYSHILPKGLYGKCRHDVRNFNNLCLVHHQLWEFGSKEQREAMNIYKPNLLIIETLKNEYGY